MKIEDEFKKLKPIFGKALDRLWMSYLLEEDEGKKEIENLLPILADQGLNCKYYEEGIFLNPPRKEDAYGEYPLGTVEYAGKEFYPFGLRENEWIQHISIFGRSGCGKTNLVFNIVNNFIEKRKPFMIFDWKRNYRDLLQNENCKNILVFTVGRDLSSFRFNPLIPPPGTHPEIWLKKLVEIIAHAYFLGQGVMYLLYKAIDSVYKTFGMYDRKVTIYPTMEDVFKEISNLRLRGRQSLWHASTTRALFSMCFGEFGKVLCTDKQVPIESLLDKHLIFELDSLTNADKVFFIEALLLWVHHYRLTQGKREEFKHAMIIEEAHHILLRSKQEMKGEETITDVILREIRELGESMIIVDQHPSLISTTAIGNSFCTIAMNLKHRNDLNMIDDALLLDDKDALGRLPMGYGVVKLQGRYFEPFLVKFPLFKVKKGKVRDEDIKKRIKGYNKGALD